MARFEAWATSPDNAVSVLAVAGGVPLEVRLSGNAMRMSPEALARAVLTTAGRAGRDATARLHRELAATVGQEATRTLERVGLPVPEADQRDRRDHRDHRDSRDRRDDRDDPDDPERGSVLWRVR